MKAVIVTPFDNYSYPVRVKYVERYLKEYGYDVTVISSDFDHRSKKEYKAKRDNLILLNVPKYTKNMSIARIKSHYVFAKKAAEETRKMVPQLVYVSGPPNFLFQEFASYKKEKTETKIIFEIGDLWPETLPLGKRIKKLAKPVMLIWAGIRNHSLKYADVVIYECRMFENKLSSFRGCRESNTVYLCKENYLSSKWKPTKMGDVVKFAYIGSINNIIDIDLIVKVLYEVSKHKKVLFKIIGDGEGKDKLVSACQEKQISFEDYGVVFDDKEKEKILSDCQFGFNIMKDSVAVGVTMKSLEYFHWGLALINNIPFDTEEIVAKYECGVNVSKYDCNKAINKIIEANEENMYQWRLNSRNVYLKYFDEKVVHEQIQEIIVQ